MAKARDVAVRVAVVEAEQAIARLRAIGTEGEAGFAKIARGAGLVPAQVKRADDAVGMFAGNAGQKFAQIGFQIGDFSTQVSGGTSALVAFSQQAPQLLGAFGPVGAVLGGLGGAALIAGTAIFGFGREAESAEAATRAMEEAARGLDGTIAGSATSVENLTQKYAALGDEMRTIERLELGKKLRDAEAGLSSIRDQIAASVRSATETGQLDFLRQSEALAKLDKGATRNTGVVQLQQYLEGLNAALEKSAKGGLTEFADEVDRLASSLPEAGSDARKLADSFIAPAESAIKFSTSIRQAQRALDELAGKPAAQGAADPFKDQAKAAEQAEKATKASQRAAAQSDRRRDALALEIEQNRRLIEAGALGAAAYEEQKRVIEAENAAIRAGLDPKGQEARILAEQTALLDEQAKARRANADAERDRLAALEETYQHELGRVGAILDGKPTRAGNDPWKEATDRLQNATADAIQDGLRSGFDAQSIVDGFGQVLTATISESVTASLFDSVNLKAGFGKKLGDLGIAGFGDATVGQAGIAALGAGFAGYGLGQQIGGPLGVLAGAGAGALAGAQFGPYGALAGGAIGGLAGLLGGGVTGGERNNNYNASLNIGTGRLLDVMNTRPDAGNVSAVQSVVAEVQALRAGLRGFGFGIGDGQLDIQSGNKSGLTLGGVRYDSQTALTEAALRQLLGGASGLSGRQRTAVANTQATTASGILSDLDLARQMDNLAKGGGQLGQQIQQNEQQFAALKARAEELGLSTKVLDKAQADGLKSLRDGVLLQIGAITPYDAALRQINQTYNELAANAEALNLSEQQLAKGRAKAIEDLRQQQQDQLQQQGQGLLGQVTGAFGFVDQLRDARAALATSDMAPGTTLDRYRAAKSQFELTRRAALGGDLEAINDLAGQGQTLLGLSRDVYGSSASYGRDFESVSTIMDRVITQGDNAQKKLIEEIKALGITQANNIQAQTRMLYDLLKDVKQFAEEVRRAGKDVSFAIKMRQLAV